MNENIEYLRSYRLGEVAVIDFLASYALIYILLKILNIPHRAKYYQLVTPISIAVHLLFGVETNLTKSITNSEFNIQKLFLALNIVTIILT